MVRVLFCRRCDAGYPSIAGDVPRVCPHCSHAAGWTTQSALVATSAVDPLKPYALTGTDGRFLKSIGIAAEDEGP